MEKLVRYIDIEIDIDKSAEYIIDTLEEAGFEAYIVGGCVRDSILNAKYNLGVSINDWDICTDAKPEKVSTLFKSKGLHVIETGLKHGTVTVMDWHGVGYEITLFRADEGYGDERCPNDVQFTSKLFEDLALRDFTINSMVYNKKQGLIGVQNSLQDLQDKLIRCVGNPYRRFEEDALRILRAMRFASVLGYIVEAGTKKAMLEMRDNLHKISKDRQGRELCKLLTGCHKLSVLQEYSDVLFEIIPELKGLLGMNQYNNDHKYDAYTHTVVATSSLGECKDTKVLLALLLHNVAKPNTFAIGENGQGHAYGHAGFGAVKAKEILKRLDFSRDMMDDVSELVKYHDTVHINKSAVKHTLNQIGHPQFQRLILVKKAINLGKSEYAMEKYRAEIDKAENWCREIISGSEAFSIKDLDINGKDLIELGYTPGPRIGSLLRELLELVMDEDLLNTKNELAKYAIMQVQGENRIDYDSCENTREISLNLGLN